MPTILFTIQIRTTTTRGAVVFISVLALTMLRCMFWAPFSSFWPFFWVFWFPGSRWQSWPYLFYKGAHHWHYYCHDPCQTEMVRCATTIHFSTIFCWVYFPGSGAAARVFLAQGTPTSCRAVGVSAVCGTACSSRSSTHTISLSFHGDYLCGSIHNHLISRCILFNPILEAGSLRSPRCSLFCSHT